MTSSKPPKRITQARLRNVALAYLRRYGGSRARLRQVLERRVERSLRFHDELARKDEVAAWVDALLRELCDAGMCDDASEAKRHALQAHLTGRSARAIDMQLRRKGFDRTAVEAALESLRASADEPDADWVACCRLARRRGLGPFRRPGTTPRPFDKELGILMRAAFPYGMARRVLETQDREELESAIDAYGLARR